MRFLVCFDLTHLSTEKFLCCMQEIEEAPHWILKKTYSIAFLGDTDHTDATETCCQEFKRVYPCKRTSFLLLNRCYKWRTDYLVMVLGSTLTSLWETLLSLLLVDCMAVWGKGLHHCWCCMLNISISTSSIEYTLTQHCYVLYSLTCIWICLLLWWCINSTKEA